MTNLAILFSFYKEPEICINHLELLKKHNPGVRIFGLYGGPDENKDHFREKLEPFLDDFYTSRPMDENWNWEHGDLTNWKWIHNDLVILEWYLHRGKDLDWSSIAIVQWDMLVFTSIEEIFKDMGDNEIFLSGLRDLTADVKSKWWHTSASEEVLQKYNSFFEYVKKHYNYMRIPPLLCQFIFEILPKNFFDAYNEVKDKELGMLEYKVPAYADIFDVPFYKKDLGVAWEDLGDDLQSFPLNASPRGELEKEYIESELAKPNGWRIFHPYMKVWRI